MYKSINKGFGFALGLCALIGMISQTQVFAQEVTGVDTLKMISYDWQYYDFTAQKAFSNEDTATYTADIIGSRNEGVNFGKEFNSLIPDRQILLLGTGYIDSVASVPVWDGNAPWVDTSWDFSYGTKGAPISVGQLWVVYTSEGKYAVMEITELPGGNYGDSFVFKYKYMSEGGTTFPNAVLAQVNGSETSSWETGYDFSTQSVGEINDGGRYKPDFVFVSNEGVNFGNEGNTSLSATGRRFLLLEGDDINTVESVPERTDTAPWVSVSYDFTNGTKGLPIAIGQLWAVFTREGNYAVMQITGLPDGEFGNSFTFN